MGNDELKEAIETLDKYVEFYKRNMEENLPPLIYAMAIVLEEVKRNGDNRYGV